MEGKRLKIIDNSLMVSDNIALVYLGGNKLKAISMWNTGLSCEIALCALKVSESNLTKGLEHRAIKAVERNKELILELMEEKENE